MAVVIMQEFKAMSQDQYDRTRAMMADTLPPGCLVHTANVIEGGMLMVDVWESQEAFEQFTQETLRRMSGALSFTSEPEVTFYPVYHLLHV